MRYETAARLLRANNVDIRNVTRDNIVRVINTLSLRRAIRAPSANYKMSLLDTLWKELRMPGDKPRQWRENLRGTDTYSGEAWLNAGLVAKTITFVRSILADASRDFVEQVCTTRSAVDAYFVVIAFFATTATPKNVLQWQYEDLRDALSRLSLDARNTRDVRVHAFVTPALAMHLVLAMNVAYTLRKALIDADIRQRGARARVSATALCVSKTDIVNKRLREMFVIHSGDDPPRSFGIHRLRRIMSYAFGASVARAIKPATVTQSHQMQQASAGTAVP